ncbi:glycosyltransferase family 2 protein [Candidatus Marinimicrobia bacterium]|nr:glycosyltransferase family 2 protein [Candidatus Neomarinimicrobiota bacterium]MDC1038462.1 glycosyltransferase family 2 protein [Candidatus Neomarinimicrobiota bacterium]
MKASVCIVNLNARKHLGLCIDSLNTALDGYASEIILVDNNSHDGSVEYLQSNYPVVFLIQNSRNEGYTKAMNQALQQAEGDYIFILNPDSRCDAYSLAKLIDFMESDPSIGICGPKVLNEDGSFQKSCRRGIPRPQAVFSYFLGLSNRYPNDTRFTGYHLNHLDENEINEVEAVSGSCCIVKKEVFESIGLLDEQFFAYQEDSDFCFRAKKGGWKIIYNPNSIMTHIGGKGGADSVPFRAIFEWHRSYYLLYQKHFSSDYSRPFNLFYSAIMFCKLIFAEGKYLLSH